MSKQRYGCPTCGAEMICRVGKYGTFMGCSRFPECRQTCNLKNVEHLPKIPSLSEKPKGQPRVAGKMNKPLKKKPSRDHLTKDVLEFSDPRLVQWRREMLESDTSDCPPWSTVDESLDVEFQEMFR